MTTLKDRFARLQSLKPDITQAEIARIAGVKPPSVNGWFSGETKSLKADSATKVASIYGVNPHWLATGEGEMRVITATARATFPAITGSATGTVGEPPPSLERALEVLASHLDQLSNIEREAAASSLQTLARAPDSAKAKSSVFDSLGAKNHTAISASAKQEIPDFLKK